MIRKKPWVRVSVVHWLGLGTSTAGARVQSLVRKLRSHTPRGVAKQKPKKPHSKQAKVPLVSVIPLYHQCNYFKTGKRNWSLFKSSQK